MSVLFGPSSLLHLLVVRAVRELPDGNAWIPLAQCPKNVVVSSLKPVTIRFYFEDDDLGNGVLCDMESPGYRGATTGLRLFDGVIDSITFPSNFSTVRCYGCGEGQMCSVF
jgi:hypothetical protein